MAKNKTTETDVDVYEFIDSYVDKEQKKTDSMELIKLMTSWSRYEPKMWDPTIIGFGAITTSTQEQWESKSKGNF